MTQGTQNVAHFQNLISNDLAYTPCPQHCLTHPEWVMNFNLNLKKDDCFARLGYLIKLTQPSHHSLKPSTTLLQSLHLKFDFRSSANEFDSNAFQADFIQCKSVFVQRYWKFISESINNFIFF